MQCPFNRYQDDVNTEDHPIRDIYQTNTLHVLNDLNQVYFKVSDCQPCYSVA